MLGCRAFRRVFLRLVAPAGEFLLAEQGVVFDVDLGVERDQLALARHDQRVDLEQARVLLEIQAVQRLGDLRELIDLLTGQAQAEGHDAALVGLQTGGRMHVHADQLFRRLFGDFFDVHAAGGRDDEGDVALVAVQHQADVQLALDLRAGLDEHLVDGQTFRPGLVGVQTTAEHLRRRIRSRLGAVHQLDAAGLAAATGMNLGLDHPLGTADAASGIGRFSRRGGDVTGRDRDAVARKELLGLIFVQVHRRVFPV